MNNTAENFIDLDTDDLLTPDEMAAILAVSVGHLANLRAKGKGPVHVRLGDGPRAPVRYLRRQPVARQRDV